MCNDENILGEISEEFKQIFRVFMYVRFA